MLTGELQFSYGLTQNEILPTLDNALAIGKLSLPIHIPRAGTEHYFLLPILTLSTCKALGWIVPWLLQQC